MLTLLSCLSGKAQQEDRPNILWIVSEDNSPLLGAYGDSFATTPHLDKFAREAVRYTHAFASAPVCAPARSTLITGMYPPAVGTQHMRSSYPVPDFVRFFPLYLREAGYYTSNNAKKDYNTIDQEEAWDESSAKATYLNRKPDQPFFAVFNTTISHESSLHKFIPADSLHHDPEKVPIPPYHPATPQMKHDWAQYYDKIQAMDAFVGKVLKELEEAGLAESTIVFYYSDHGGVLGRSKRFMYESGLHIPLIIRFPKKYAHLAPGHSGSRTDRIVSFVDFAPTILSLAGVPIPHHMQGKAFLGKAQAPPSQYAFAFRGRMDERLDMVRSVRDKRYRYIRNYMPHKIYGQYLEYLWKAPSMQSWEDAYKAGTLNEVQSRFWQPKPVEELYDTEADPHNIFNLAGQSPYQKVLKRMRAANRRWQLDMKDVGFIPEAMMADITQKMPLYTYARSGEYPLEKVMETAEMASEGELTHMAELTKRLQDQNAVVRYWAVTGCTILKEKAMPAKSELNRLLQDPEVAVRIVAAEALYGLGEKEKAAAVLAETLQTGNRMARLQALTVLETMGKDALPALKAARSLLKANPGDEDYDVRAAKRLLEVMAKQ
ncbi:sulfatase-like hydrolase/transferase [Rhodocytophaga aerolata]|uniref:Sulfatase-like hydrolase/transferase n=1 Tax=Rhodocytophaga aerolata TaxID=455078 RepID=A0ABT8RH73_9BACT|nr:sulfatase-like hydrolase/transferase [Rhodocytophaga aerolata]MDO1451462.1 sulfatase-like hydrolase/transferase [Rhodocytophaga aerolata]